ncbi:Putative bifunctional exonuclease/endonuclease protein [Frankliniella fusca]|uniref:Bifunctional exonuclease/endonuclease protein n=1 Tax=Frankliniella fusca TaxID=407009 RepID=A0AAE1H494_9NEOP|nr:Putative bifunctional exonuclease/endonuclease protein [Frankliniella fusca]
MSDLESAFKNEAFECYPKVELDKSSISKHPSPRLKAGDGVDPAEHRARHGVGPQGREDGRHRPLGLTDPVAPGGRSPAGGRGEGRGDERPQVDQLVDPGDVQTGHVLDARRRGDGARLAHQVVALGHVEGEPDLRKARPDGPKEGRHVLSLIRQDKKIGDHKANEAGGNAGVLERPHHAGLLHRRERRLDVQPQDVDRDACPPALVQDPPDGEDVVERGSARLEAGLVFCRVLPGVY